MRVLVTASSKHGATGGIAEEIGRVIGEHGLDALVLPIEDASDIAGFDAFVIGSAVYAGRWMGEARRFTERHAEELASHPTWLFSSGPVGDPPKPEPASAVKLADVIAKTGAREHRLFAGRLDRRQLGLGERTVVRMVGAPEGDYRDWKDVGAWAAAIAETLQSCNEPLTAKGAKPGSHTGPATSA
jgi:menaquinone-dependent protoporphyrinogen oxidase